MGELTAFEISQNPWPFSYRFWQFQTSSAESEGNFNASKFGSVFILWMSFANSVIRRNLRLWLVRANTVLCVKVPNCMV
jgi:hypothetical protein